MRSASLGLSFVMSTWVLASRPGCIGGRAPAIVSEGAAGGTFFGGGSELRSHPDSAGGNEEGRMGSASRKDSPSAVVECGIDEGDTSAIPESVAGWGRAAFSRAVEIEGLGAGGEATSRGCAGLGATGLGTAGNNATDVPPPGLRVASAGLAGFAGGEPSGAAGLSACDAMI
jgi:hypothetical protein